MQRTVKEKSVYLPLPLKLYTLMGVRVTNNISSLTWIEAVMFIAGPDILTLTIGSDIARGPNTPRPPCRGYLHKRTQSGLIKGWRKRWFVLTHDCCLYYYKNKRVSIGREHEYRSLYRNQTCLRLPRYYFKSRMKASGSLYHQ